VFRAGLDAPGEAARERRYYEDDYFRELAWDQLEGFRDGIYREALDRIEGQVGRGRLLDVGCGCGFLLREALGRGWDAKGIDPSRESIEYLRSTIGDVGIQGSLEDCSPGERYDAVTMINVLDHLVDPWKAAEQAAGLLRPGGAALRQSAQRPVSPGPLPADAGLGSQRRRRAVRGVSQLCPVGEMARGDAR